MLFCDYEDLKKKLPETNLIRLSNDKKLSEADIGVITECIQYASDEILPFLGKILKLPVQPENIPPLIRSLCAVMSIYHLYERKMEEIPETRENAYNNAFKTLKMLVNGDLSLGIAEPLPEGVLTDQSRAVIQTRPKMFSKSVLDLY